MVSRFIKNQLIRSLQPQRVVVLLGARQTGKTVLMDLIKEELKAKKILLIHGENLEAVEILSSQKTAVLHRFVQGYDYLFIDEAQKIPRIGINLKLLVDTQSQLSIFITGSSSFDLRNRVGEPLVGSRSRYFHLYPLSVLELSKQEDYLQSRQELEMRLIYGLYPRIFSAKSLAEKQAELVSLRDGYLLKDILELDNLKDSLFIFNLLRLIAFQIGNNISYNELASNLNANKKTVMRYLELLEKTFVLFSLSGFSRNLRKEYTKTPRYYFWDNGIRNILISNLNPLHLRDDVGKLWENFCIVERIKKTTYQKLSTNRYFWRTYDKQEIDYLEERGGKIYGYEMKWKQQYSKAPKSFTIAYPHAEFTLVNQDNYEEFIGRDLKSTKTAM